MKHRVTILTAILLTGITVNAQNWPQWRGPDANGVAAPGSYPVMFSAADNLLWQAPLPGKGGSTPIVWKDRIVITCGVGDGDDGLDGVLCFDWSGKQLWATTLGKQVKGKHRRGSGSCPSAVTDGKRIFAYFKSGTLAALDFNGKVLWKTNLQKRYGKNTLWWDLGTTPVLANENVIIAVMHTGSSYIVAFNQSTGEEIWKVDRNYNCPVESDHSYTTPLVIKKGDQTTLVIWGADHLTSHDAANGKMIWECGGFNPNKKRAWRVIASPIISRGIAVVPYGREKFTAGVKLGGSGDITETARVWEKTGISADATTPVASDGKAYLINYKGKVWCLDILTGKELWNIKVPDGKGQFYSSPTLAGDKLYICREKGAVYVYQISPTGQKLLNQTQFDDHFVASPVLIQDKLLLRGEKNLYCIGK